MVQINIAVAALLWTLLEAEVAKTEIPEDLRKRIFDYFGTFSPRVVPGPPKAA